MTDRPRALLLGPVLLLVVGLLVALLPTTRAAFSGSASVAGPVTADALADRLVVERPDPATAREATTPLRTYVQQVRPLGGGLVAGLPAARSADDGGTAATVTETGSDRLRVPENGGLDSGTQGWSGSAALGAGHATTGGVSGGALRFTGNGSAAGPVTSSVVWSTAFPHTGGSRAVTLRHAVRLASSKGLLAGAVLTADLVAPTGAVTRLSRSPLAPGPVADGGSPWRTATGEASGAVISGAGDYVLRLTATLPLRQGSDASAVALVDDVALDVTGVVLGPEPKNRTFATGTDGWTSTVTSEPGTAAVPSFSPTDGEPVGSMRVSITGTLAATGTVTWSTEFDHVGGSAGKATLALSHRILLGNQVTEETGYTVRLRKPGGDVTTVAPFRRMVPVEYPGLDPAWTRRSLTVPTSALDETGTYRLEVHTQVTTNRVSGGNTNAVGLSIGYDNIQLDRVATGRHLDVEAVVPVAYRSAARLEWRAATTGDPVEVSVWRGGAWRSVGSVAATSLTERSVPLTHRADAAESEVRVRFESVKDANVDDVLRLDWLRVVPLDPPLRPADTDLTLPPVAHGGTAPVLPGLVRLRNRGATPLDLTLAADAPVLAWAGFDVASAAGGTSCTTGWTDGSALSTRCLLPPGGSVSVDVRVVGGRTAGAWTAALVLSDAARPGFYRTVLPAAVQVTA